MCQRIGLPTAFRSWNRKEVVKTGNERHRKFASKCALKHTFRTFEIIIIFQVNDSTTSLSIIFFLSRSEFEKHLTQNLLATNDSECDGCLGCCWKLGCCIDVEISGHLSTTYKRHIYIFEINLMGFLVWTLWLSNPRASLWMCVCSNLCFWNRLDFVLVSNNLLVFHVTSVIILHMKGSIVQKEHRRC